MLIGTAHSASTISVALLPPGVNANVGTLTTVQIGAVGSSQPTPKNPSLPRLRSSCLAGGVQLPLPSNLRSKSAVANVTMPPASTDGLAPSLKSSKMVGSVPSPMRQLQEMMPVCPANTPNPVGAGCSAALAASPRPPRPTSQMPGGLSGERPPIE